jgi:hypothetical protein
MITKGARVRDAVVARVYGIEALGTVTRVYDEDDLVDVIWDNDPTGEPEQIRSDELQVVTQPTR